MEPRAPFLADAPVLVISPHFDDVALSCSALVARRAPLTVLDVCTAGPAPAVSGDWDRRTGFADSDLAVAARRAEERAAFAGTPHELRDLALLDGQYGDGGLDAEGRALLVGAIEAWIATAGPGRTVLVPVGAGCEPGALAPVARVRARLRRDQIFPVHPDHVAVRDAALDALRSRTDVAVVLYEEVPYRGTRRGDRAARAVAGRLGTRVERLDVGVDRDAKAQRLAAYASQLPFLFPARALRDGLAAHLPATERYWTVHRG